MIVSTEEINWVKDRLNWYVIPYQEIYDEITDHVLSAVEAKRMQGNREDIGLLFQQIIAEHFDGVENLEKLAKEQELTYRKKLRQSFKANLTNYYNFKGISFLFIMLSIGAYLPRTKAIIAILLISLLAILFLTSLYALWLNRNNSVQKGKKSLSSIFIAVHVYLPMTLLSSAFNLPNAYFTFFGNPEIHNRYAYIPTTVLTALLAIMIMYSLSCIEAFKKEYKISN